MTVLFWHTQGSVLLAIAMHGTLGRDIAQGLFPTATPPPDWLRAVDLIAITAVIVAVTRCKTRSRGDSRLGCPRNEAPRSEDSHGTKA